MTVWDIMAKHGKIWGFHVWDIPQMGPIKLKVFSCLNFLE